MNAAYAPIVRGPLFLDLEVRRSAEEVGGFGPTETRMRGMAVAATLDSSGQTCRVYGEPEVLELIGSIESAECVVGYNLSSFDFEVLRGYGDFDPPCTVDLLRVIADATGRRVPLGMLASANLPECDLPMDVDPVALWKSGSFPELKAACRGDVKAIRELYMLLKNRGWIWFPTGPGTPPDRVEIPLPALEPARPGSGQLRQVPPGGRASPHETDGGADDPLRDATIFCIPRIAHLEASHLGVVSRAEMDFPDRLTLIATQPPPAALGSTTLVRAFAAGGGHHFQDWLDPREGEPYPEIMGRWADVRPEQPHCLPPIQDLKERGWAAGPRAVDLLQREIARMTAAHCLVIDRSLFGYLDDRGLAAAFDAIRAAKCQIIAFLPPLDRAELPPGLRASIRYELVPDPDRPEKTVVVAFSPD